MADREYAVGTIGNYLKALPEVVGWLRRHRIKALDQLTQHQLRVAHDYQRQRADLITMGAAHVQHMQKALDRMNVKVHDVISSLIGVSGLKMVRAILAGERTPERLAALCDAQILKKKKDRLLKALVGNWQAEHLFALRQGLEGWEFYQRQIGACDEQMAQVLQQLAHTPPGTGGEESAVAATVVAPLWPAQTTKGMSRRLTLATSRRSAINRDAAWISMADGRTGTRMAWAPGVNSVSCAVVIAAGVSTTRYRISDGIRS